MATLRRRALFAVLSPLLAACTTTTTAPPTDATTGTDSRPAPTVTASFDLPSGGVSAPSTAAITSAPATSTAPADVRRVTVPAAFATPSGRIVCMLADDSIRCDFVGGDKAWTAPKPANCELDWGSSLYVAQTARSTCAGDTVIDTASVDSDYVSWRKADDPTVKVYDLTLAALPYGSAIAVGAFQCDSATTGVTCRNTRTGHGFTMAREAYSMF